MVRVGVGLLLAGAGCSEGGWDGWQVDRVEDGRAVLVRGASEAKTVQGRALPAGLREGDVLRGGALDATQRRLLADRVRLAREVAPASAGNFELDPSRTRLTLGGQR